MTAKKASKKAAKQKAASDGSAPGSRSQLLRLGSLPILWLAFWLGRRYGGWSQGKVAAGNETGSSASGGSHSSSGGLGKAVAQPELLTRLLELLQEVQQWKQQQEEAGKATDSSDMEGVLKKAEDELREIEALIDPASPNGKQSVGLVGLVRAALHAEKDGSESSFPSEWNDEALFKEHGLITYESQSYWDEAYSAGKYGSSFEWYGGWDDPTSAGTSLATVLRPLLAKESKVLMLGCGNSNVSVDMYKEGFKTIMNVDVSEPVIQQMRERHAELPGLEWRAMDARDMHFEAAHFDAVIEKGLFDALFAGTASKAPGVLAEAGRILRKGGLLVSISFSKTRVKDLFAANSGESHEKAEGSTEGHRDIELPSFECRIEAELDYSGRRGANASDDKSGKGSVIHVYVCIRGD